MKVEVVYDQSISVEKWQRQYADGLVPSKWPYGLDLVEREGLAVMPTVASKRTLASDLWSSIVRRLRSLASRNACRASMSGISIAWDEVSAIALLGTSRRTIRGCGVIWMQDSTVGLKARAHRWTGLQTLRNMDFVWCLSAAQAKALHAAYGQHQSVELLRFGIDEQFFEYTEYPENQLVFSAGNDRHRDIETLYAAFHLVHDELPDVQFAVQTNSNVKVPSFVKQLPRMTHKQLREWYQKASVIAVACKPNMHVSGMTVALESMSVGRPVVITDTLGMDEYVEHGHTGYLVQPYDPVELAARIVATLCDQEKAAELGLAGSAKVKEKHTTLTMADALASMVRRQQKTHQTIKP